MNDERTTSVHRDDDPLLRTVGRLPKTISPERDLWPAIARGLEAPAGKSAPRLQLRWSHAFAAAAGCVALGALLSYSMLQTGKSPADTTPVPFATSKNMPAMQARFGGYGPLGPEYERARGALLIDLAERLDRLPPDARLQIERDLATIHRAVWEINAALELAPDDRLLRELLITTYQAELGVLTNVNQMTGTLPTRT